MDFYSHIMLNWRKLSSNLQPGAGELCAGVPPHILLKLSVTVSFFEVWGIEGSDSPSYII
jgi:hypothetical protein